MLDPDVDTVRRAIRNNASWCDLVCRAHGFPGEFLAEAWLNRQPTPRFYPNVITLSPSLTSSEAARLLSLSSDANPSLKDSFRTLDLGPYGYTPLFAARWLTACPPMHAADIAWERVTDPQQLARWELAWGRAPGDPVTFPASLLNESSTTFYAGFRAGDLVAGGIVHLSHGVAGLSNVFAAPAAGRYLPSLTEAVVAGHGDVPIVGYESGEALQAAMQSGYRALGPLTVWVRHRQP